MPAMAEVDPDTDQILRVVTLPEEIRDDHGDSLVYDRSAIAGPPATIGDAPMWSLRLR